VRIVVTFEIDTDGILRVKAKDEESGNTQGATIRVLGTMTEAEIQEAMQKRQDDNLPGAG